MNLNHVGRKTPSNPRGTIEQRMESGSIINPQTGCIEWRKSKNNRGYGAIYFEGRLRLAHRVAYFLAAGAWPNPDMVVDHICEVKSCVNADHLRELTNRQNLQRAYPIGDEVQEANRARWRAANAKRRNYRYVEGGDSDSLVQS